MATGNEKYGKRKKTRAIDELNKQENAMFEVLCTQ